MHGYIYIYVHMQIHVHIHICIYICICLHAYIYLHNSCMRTCATVQQLPCHGSYCDLILSLARTSCRLSFLPTLLPLRRAGRSCWPVARHVRLRNPTKSTLAHDAVAAVMFYNHHLIIRVGAGLIQFVYGSHSRLAADLTLDNNLFYYVTSWLPWISVEISSGHVLCTLYAWNHLVKYVDNENNVQTH